MTKCKHCEKEYDEKEIQRVNGNVPWTWACCSAQCYTQHQLKCQAEDKGFKCECGNDQFYAHQVCHLDVKVDGDNMFLNNEPNDKSACYEAGTPFGPYTCTKCGKETEEIPEK